MKRFALPLLGLLPLPVVGGACGTDPTIVPTRNLERPYDMGFVCVAAVGDRVSGQRMSFCHPPRNADPKVDMAARGQGTFALVTNTARGELAVIDLDAGRLRDLDPRLPGFNMLPVGQLPESVAVSRDGCRAITANQGSCDLTLVDTSRLLAPQLLVKAPSTGAGSPTLTVTPQTRSGRLQVTPDEVVFLNQTVPILPPQGRREDFVRASRDGLCQSAGATLENRIVPWRVLVTFPGCDLLAEIELPSGRVRSSFYVRPDGVAPAGDDPVCPVECTGEPGPAAPASLRVGPMALLPDGRRVYVGGANAPFIVAFDVTDLGLQAVSGGGVIPLHEDATGTTRLRLTVDPYGVEDGSAGRFIGERGQFLYALARDGSVRVVDLGSPAARHDGLPEHECDLNVDPPAFARVDTAKDGCTPWTDDPQIRARLPRRPLAQGPGLRIPVVNDVDIAPPLPRDIAFASLKVPNVTVDADRVVDGVFGYLLASTGQVYLVNVDPTLRSAEQPPPFTHSLRNGNVSTQNEGSRGTPRLEGEPARVSTTTDVPFGTSVTYLNATDGPRFEVVQTAEASMKVGPYLVFPDPSMVMPMRWSIIWEGVLPGSSRSSGRIQGPTAGGAPGGGGGVLADAGADFCKTGVFRGDVVTMLGCKLDTDCSIDKTARCIQQVPGAPGMCFPKDLGKDDARVRDCSRHMESRRRYEVVHASKTRLELGLKLDEVPRPTIRPCRVLHDEDCQPDRLHGPLVNGAKTDLGFQCLVLKDGEPPRCVKRCALPDVAGQAVKNDRACRAGHVCEDVGAPPEVGPLCVEGPPLAASCWLDTAPYRVQVGRGFLVSGSLQTPLPIGREIGGACVADPARHPLLANRIPIGPFSSSWADGAGLHCKDVPDTTEPSTPPAATQAQTAASQAPSVDAPAGGAAAWGNPCFFTGPNEDERTGNTAAMHVKALFQNPSLRFVLTNLEDYAGDGLGIGFTVSGGFVPELVATSGEASVTLGSRILTSPTKTPESPQATNPADVYFPYLFVVDQGRASAGSRGQVLRLNPRTGVYGAGRYDSSLSSSTYPVQ